MNKKDIITDFPKNLQTNILFSLNFQIYRLSKEYNFQIGHKMTSGLRVQCHINWLRKSLVFYRNTTLDNAKLSQMGMNQLSKTCKCVMHKATLTACGKDLINEVHKTVNVYFTEEKASETRKLSCHRNSYERYFNYSIDT